MIQSCPMISNRKYRTTVFKLARLQLVMGLVVTVSFAAYKQSLNTAFSGIAGILLAIIPTVVYARVAFGKRSVEIPVVALSRHKKGMIARFLLNLVLFAVILFFYKKCDYIALFVVYFIVLAGYWVSLVKL